MNDILKYILELIIGKKNEALDKKANEEEIKEDLFLMNK